MTKPNQITYDTFVEAAIALEKSEQRVTMRAVRERIGGSNSKILAFLRTWQAEKQASAELDAHDISEGFQQALLAEFGRVVQKTRERLEKQLTIEKNNTQEAQDSLVELEKNTSALEKTLTQQVSESKQSILKLEKAIAALEARLNDAKQREVNFIQKLEACQARQHQAEIEAAVATSRCQALEKHNKQQSKRHNE